MASTQQIKRRIRSVKNTKQITKAMELVSASKMRKSQDAMLASRPYANAAVDILNRISQLINVDEHELYEVRPVRRRLHVVVSSDRGLAGAYNSNILKSFAAAMRTDRESGVTSHVITIGRTAGRFVSKLEDVDVLGAYDGLPEKPSEEDIRPIYQSSMQLFCEKAVDEVLVHFTDFKSSLTQEATSRRLLPSVFKEPEISEDPVDSNLFEPSPAEVLNSVTPRLVEARLMQMLLESFASEHSMRMMAMKSASDNATDLIDDLTLAYNGARQAAITQELAEITGGAEAIS